MNFGTMKQLARAFVSEAKVGKVGEDEIAAIINIAKTEVASRAICLKKNTKFSSKADINEYNLSSILERYLTPDKSGLLYRTSTSTNYRKLFSRTLDYFDKNRPDWRDAASGDPTDYAIDGDNLIVVPTPSTVITDAFWFYYGQDSEDMTDDAHFPFGNVTEIHRLKPLQKAIVKYTEWDLVKSVNKGADNFRIKENEYNREIDKQIALLKRRTDIASHRDSRMKFAGGGYSGF